MPVSARNKMAFVIYLVNALALLAFGVVYLSCSTILPYHRQAMNMNWEELNTGLQVLFQAFMKMVASSFLLAGLSMLILLFIPFKKGAPWAHWAIPLLGLVSTGFALYVSATVTIKTHALTPWPVALTGIILIVAAFLLSPGRDKSGRAESSFGTK